VYHSINSRESLLINNEPPGSSLRSFLIEHKDKFCSFELIKFGKKSVTATVPP